MIKKGSYRIYGFWPYSFTMCIENLPWGVASKNTLRGEMHCTRVPNSRINVIFCGAGFRPGRRGPFVSAKDPKTIDAPSDLIREDGRHLAEGGPTRGACPESYRRVQAPALSSSRSNRSNLKAVQSSMFKGSRQD
jgi:hypothetical protein